MARAAKQQPIISRGSIVEHGAALGMQIGQLPVRVVSSGEQVHHIGWYYHGSYTSTGLQPGSGRWNSHEPWCARRDRRPNADPPVTQTLTLDELTGLDACRECRVNLHVDVEVLEARGEDVGVTVASLRLAVTRDAIARAADTPRKITPSALQGRLRKVSQGRHEIEQTFTGWHAQQHPGQHVSAAESEMLRSAREALDEAVELAQTHLRTLFQAEGTGDAILAQIREAMYGTGSSISIDETPTLVGLPQRCHIKGRIATAVLARYGLECGQGRVILVPRYIADWVLCNLQSGSQCAQTTAAPQSAEQAALAAGLWDPASDGPARSLRDMVTAANEVLSTE